MESLDTSNLTASWFNETAMNNSTMSLSPPQEDTSLQRPPPPYCTSGADYSNYVADVIIAPPIVVFGVIGNIISFVVMCMQKPAVATTTLILRYLAIIDTLILLAAIPLRTLRTIQICHAGVLDWYGATYTMYVFFYGMPTLFILRMIGTWLTALLTVDRYIAVCKPLSAQRLITLKGAFYQITLITIASILFSLPNYFEYQIWKHGQRLAFGYREFARTKEYIFIYKVVLAFLIMYIIPIFLMLILNIKLVFGLRSAAKEARHLQRSVSNESSVQLHTSVTAIVVGIVATFIVCNTLALVSHSLFSLLKCFPFLKFNIDMPRRYITQLSNTFVTINSAVNFLIYCVCSRNFRTTFLRVFRCEVEQRLRNRRRRKSRQSSGSGNTHVSLLSGSTRKAYRETKPEREPNEDCI